MIFSKLLNTSLSTSDNLFVCNSSSFKLTRFSNASISILSIEFSLKSKISSLAKLLNQFESTLISLLLPSEIRSAFERSSNASELMFVNRLLSRYNPCRLARPFKRFELIRVSLLWDKSSLFSDDN